MSASPPGGHQLAAAGMDDTVPGVSPSTQKVQDARLRFLEARAAAAAAAHQQPQASHAARPVFRPAAGGTVCDQPPDTEGAPTQPETPGRGGGPAEGVPPAVSARQLTTPQPEPELGPQDRCAGERALPAHAPDNAITSRGQDAIQLATDLAHDVTASIAQGTATTFGKPMGVKTATPNDTAASSWQQSLQRLSSQLTGSVSKVQLADIADGHSGAAKLVRSLSEAWTPRDVLVAEKDDNHVEECPSPLAQTAIAAIRQAFMALDMKGNGIIASVPDLRDGMAAVDARLLLRPQAAYMLFGMLDTEMEGHVTLGALERYVIARGEAY